jgi:hypothetical protein
MTGDECKCPFCQGTGKKNENLLIISTEDFQAGFEAGYDVALEDAAKIVEDCAEEGAFDVEERIRKLRP